MKVVAIIPARMGSSRYPGKPLAKINGMPMLGHCYFRTKMSAVLDDTIVATCDTEIYDYVSSIGGTAIMTSAHHERASDRTAEAMLAIEERTGEQIDVVVMVQGDEPMVTPTMIEAALHPILDNNDVNVVNLMARITCESHFADPNEVKVVVGKDGNALYFSREPIPSLKKTSKEADLLKQVCVIPFRRDYLLKFNSMAETPLEQAESVDMLRVIENGDAVRMVLTSEQTFSVDTEQEKNFVESLMKDDSLAKEYNVV